MSKFNLFSFLGSWKSWKVVRICTEKINEKVEQTVKKIEFKLVINQRELQPAINIFNLVKLGAKIVGPAGITDFKNMGIINPEDIKKMVLILPKLKSSTGERIGSIQTSFARIRFNDCSATEVGTTDWFCAKGNDYSISDFTEKGIVKNLFELEAYANGSKFILE